MEHQFKVKSFYKPSYCNHCSTMIWGIMNQGYQCNFCNYICHERCLKQARTNVCVPNCEHQPTSSASSSNSSSSLPASEWKDPLVTALLQTGHEFKLKTFYKPTYCQHCSELLWGLMNQGYQCTVCNFVSHERCLTSLHVYTGCCHLLSEEILFPVAHQWIGPKPSVGHRKKWCNTCRMRINGPVHFCQVCRRYAHGQCIEHSLNNCKESATYTSVASVPFEHHWVEGNLPSHSKCEMCAKSCFTDLCLTGFRCGWCGLTLHSHCLDSYKIVPSHNKCTFRDLSYMMLPPSCVSFPVTHNSLQQHKDETMDDKDVTDLFSDEDDTSTKSRPVIVIDGSKKDERGGGGGGGGEGKRKWRKKTLHPIHVDQRMTASELLHVSLRKCSIPSSSDEFYLVESDTEKEISSTDIIYNIQQSYTGPLKLFIRKRKVVNDRYALKVANSNLPAQLPFVDIIIDEHTTAMNIIDHALVMFGLKEEDSINYCLYEIDQTRGVTERVLLNIESPWKQIQELMEDSYKSVSQLRYYLHRKENISCTFYLWKVNPVHLENDSVTIQYLTQCLSETSIDISTLELGPTFPKLGSLFVNVHCTTTAELFYRTIHKLADCCIKIIPTIKEEILTAEQEPLLIFINGRSGGNDGIELISGFSRHLNPHQVYDLSEGGPLPGLYSFRKVSKYRVLVGGGDGTVGWVLSGLDMMRQYLIEPSPPTAVLPLGTGNDLARALNWGSGYSGEKLMSLLYSIEDADIKPFDRWSIEFKELIPEAADHTGDSKTVIMNNYLGIGIDAEIALEFHQAREDHPEKFNSRFHNKSVYLQLGVQKTFSRDASAELHTCVSIKVDDKLIRLPTGLKGIILLNIESWGAGSEPWGNDIEEGFVKNTFDDGIIEVMGLSGAMHIGHIKSSLKKGTRIAQGKKILITLSSPMAVHVDGEAWDQTPCIMEINTLPYQSNMLCKSLFNPKRSDSIVSTSSIGPVWYT